MASEINVAARSAKIAIENEMGCLFTKSKNECFEITDIECGGAWIKIKNICDAEETFTGL